MKTQVFKSLMLLMAVFFTMMVNAQDSGFYSLEMTGIKGETVDFSQFKGKKVLIVNTASECGYTPQYEGLEALYKKYKDQGLVVLGFPSNNFGGQEPGDNLEIVEFCQENYGVSFPLFEKSDVKGDEKNKVYQWLTSKEANGWNEEQPSWNFCKYLIDENGKLIAFFPSKVKPLSEEIVSKL